MLERIAKQGAFDEHNDSLGQLFTNNEGLIPI